MIKLASATLIFGVISLPSSAQMPWDSTTPMYAPGPAQMTPWDRVSRSWTPITRACWDKVSERHHCASCGGLWAEAAACTIPYVYPNGQITQSLFNTCQLRVRRDYQSFANDSMLRFDGFTRLMRCVSTGGRAA